MEARQRRVDAVCAALAAADASRVAEFLADDCAVRVVSAAGDSRARGSAGTALLTKTLADDGPWGEQIRGDVHVSETTWTVVFSHRAGGASRNRVVVVQFGRDDRIGSLTVYGFPL
jgi:hypothetical protein